MRIIGIDPGTRYLGWGIIDLEDGRRILPPGGFGVLTSKKSSVPERIYELWRGLSIIRKTWVPDVCAIEVAFIYQNPQTTMRLAEARGACFVAMAGLPIHQHDNNKIKKALTGRGNATKEQLGVRVKKILGIHKANHVPEDALDALGNAIYHHKTTMEKRKYSLEVCDTQIIKMPEASIISDEIKRLETEAAWAGELRRD